MKRLTVLLLAAPLLLWLTALIIIPHLELLLISLRTRTPAGYAFTFAHYREFFSEPLYWSTFARTALYSIVVTALTLLLAFPLAYYIAKLARGRRQRLLFLLCLLPFWVAELIRTFGWMILLRETGLLSGLLRALGLTAQPVELLYNDAAMLVGLVYASILFMVVPLVSALESLDDALIEAAHDLGGSTASILREIVIPHAMPGIASGCIVVFMLTLGNYLTPALLGGKNSLWFTEQIYAQFITRFNWEQGAAFGFVLLLASSTIVWLGLRLSGQRLADTVR